MYDNLGIHWASSIPAFLALACVPAPFLFYKYGAAIRSKCKFAAESVAFMEKLQQHQIAQENDSYEKSEVDDNQASTLSTSDDGARAGDDERLRCWICALEEFTEQCKGLAEAVHEWLANMRFAGGCGLAFRISGLAQGMHT